MGSSAHIRLNSFRLFSFFGGVYLVVVVRFLGFFGLVFLFLFLRGFVLVLVGFFGGDGFLVWFFCFFVLFFLTEYFNRVLSFPTELTTLWATPSREKTKKQRRGHRNDSKLLPRTALVKVNTPLLLSATADHSYSCLTLCRCSYLWRKKIIT